MWNVAYQIGGYTTAGHRHFTSQLRYEKQISVESSHTPPTLYPQWMLVSEGDTWTLTHSPVLYEFIICQSLDLH
jgi:hypothetical protein